MAQPAVPLPPPTFDELYRQIQALPQSVTGEILEPGVLRTMSRPGEAHRQAHIVLLDGLRGFNRRTRGTGWWIEHEAEIRFPLGRLAVPDISGFRVERIPKMPNENPLMVLPDWACEVLSPSTDRVDRLTKMPLYARSGVPWIWLVDPSKRTIEVFETLDGRPALTAISEEEERVNLPPFGELDLTGIWLTDPETA